MRGEAAPRLFLHAARIRLAHPRGGRLDLSVAPPAGFTDPLVRVDESLRTALAAYGG